MAYGICRLTGMHEKLVRCHLIPKAVTSAPDVNVPRVEAGEGQIPRRRFDSWYDKNIVTRAGEDILAFYDEKAIPLLRRIGLVWSSPRPLRLPDEQLTPVGKDWYFAQVALRPGEGKWLKLFSLSLLWRAAITELQGFTTIKLGNDRIEQIAAMLRSKNSDPKSAFPVVLTQLNSDGGWHNVTPTYREVDAEDGAKLRSFRFYFDGLVANIYDEETDPVADRWGDFHVGASDTLNFSSRPFEGSHQEDRINTLMIETMRDHAPLVETIFSRRRGKDIED